MAKKIYVGVDNQPKKVRKIYVGINGVAKRVKKIYVGINNIAKCIFSSDSLNLKKINTVNNTTNRYYTASAAIPDLASGNSNIYALFTGGTTSSGQTSKTIQIIDSSGTVLTSANLTANREGVLGTSCNNIAFFAGGRNNTTESQVAESVSITNGSASVTKYTLSNGRSYDSSAIVSCENFVLIAGNDADIIDIFKYDSTNKNFTREYSTPIFSSPRNSLAGASSNGIVAFGGGMDTDGYYSNMVNGYYYDESSKHFTSLTVSPSPLDEARYYLTAGSNNKYILFAGGIKGSGTNNCSKCVDVYQVNTNNNTKSLTKITSMELPIGIGRATSTTIDNNILLANNTNIYVFDKEDLSMYILEDSLSQQTFYPNSSNYGDYVFFSGGASKIDIFKKQE